MAGTWDFVPNGLVVENTPPEQQGNIQFNGWTFSAKPVVPYQMGFLVTLHGLQWFLQSNGLYDDTTSPTINARRFEEFVQSHGVWSPFTFPHPHLGSQQVRFRNLPKIPKAIENSNGVIEAFEVELIQHNPGYS